MLPGLWNFHHIYYSCPSALPYTWISTKVCEERGVQQRGCHPNQFSLLHTMGSYSGDSEYSLYDLPEWLLISMSCYFSLFSLGSQRTLHLFLRSIWAGKGFFIFHGGKYTCPSHTAHLCRHCFRASRLPVSWDPPEKLYSAFHYSGAAYFGYLQSVLCSTACLPLLSEELLALVGLSGV